MRKAFDGLVLRATQSGDNDRRLLVLTADEGKMWIMAKGAKSVRSKYASIAREYTYANIEIYEKNGARWLSGGSVNKSFFIDELESFSLAAYIAQVADEITGEQVDAHDVLRMTLNTLYALEQKLKPRELIKATYELFAANVSGFMPNLDTCPDCQKNCFEAGEELWLDVMNGTIVCAECLRKRSGDLPLPDTDRFEARNILIPLDSASLEAMRYVTQAPLQRIFAFGLSERSLTLFQKAAETYLLNHLERDFETLHFYNSIKD